MFEFLKLFTRVVILDNLKVIREGFNHPAFSGRPHIALFELVSQGKHGKDSVTVNIPSGPKLNVNYRFCSISRYIEHRWTGLGW